MKQKYSILKNDENDELIIKEFAELDKEMLSFLCQENFYDYDVKSAIERGGKSELVALLRTQNMYPPILYADKIAEAVIEMYRQSDGEKNDDNASKKNQTIDLIFNDLDFLTKEPEPEDIIEEIEDDPDDIDELLDDDLEDNFDDKNAINNINSPIKIADDESLDIEDDI